VGLPVSQLDAVAKFVRGKVGSRAFIYVNECVRTFAGRYENGTDYPGYMRHVPSDIDFVSVDICASPRPPTPRPRPTTPATACSLHSGLAADETRAQSLDPKRGGGFIPVYTRSWYERHVYPALAPHQRVWIVPGVFADTTIPRNVS